MFKGTSSRNGVKHPYDDAARYDTETNRHPSSSKNGSSQSITRTVKSGTKTGPKVNKISAKAGETVGVFHFSCVNQKRQKIPNRFELW